MFITVIVDQPFPTFFEQDQMVIGDTMPICRSRSEGSIKIEIIDMKGTNKTSSPADRGKRILVRCLDKIFGRIFSSQYLKDGKSYLWIWID